MQLSAPQVPAYSRLAWIVFGLGFVLLLALVAGLWHLRRETLDSQARELNLLSLALTDELTRGLEGVEEGLRALDIEMHEGRLPPNPADAAGALRTRADFMPLVTALWVTFADGRDSLRSSGIPPPEPHSFTPPLNRLAPDSVAVGRVFTDPVTREALVTIAIGAAGAVSGTDAWLLAAIPERALLGAFSAASPAADARMAVFRADGARLAGSRADTPGFDEAGVAAWLATQPGLALRQSGDGSEHFLSVRRIPRYGLAVVLTRDLGVILLPWRQSAELTAAAAGVALLVLAASFLLVRRADQRRRAADRALQARLQRASKLEAMGTLAGGVAHDFNNVLAAIVGYGEMAQDAAAAGSAQARHLNNVIQAAARGKALVERILAFSHGAGQVSAVFELEPVVEEALRMLAASLRPDIEVERAFDAAEARLRGDPTLVFEAVMNLCTNAVQAMPAGGRLTVRTARQHVGTERMLSHSRLGTGDYVMLAVVDHGTGIAADVMEHLFEPFFTTRREHMGTGLGLAVVHGVVTEYGGAVDVQSAPGSGTCFSLFFPECVDAAGIDPGTPSAVPRGAGQTVLVVDDEEALVTLAREMLEDLGYRPVGYSDPVDALQELRRHPQRFAAIITDEVMPRLNGTQFTEELRAFVPDVPVLLVSGYGGTMLAARAATVGVTRILGKPLRRSELSRALADLLR